MSGSWQPLALSSQPTFNVSTMLLLTDGTVLCHDAGPQQAGSPNWYKLTPNQFGSYLNGTWSSVAAGPNSPQFFASAVMRDGRVFVAGGEYNGSNTPAELLAAEIYDPVSNVWTSLSTPAGWTQIGDAPCCMMPDGRILLGPPGTTDKRTAIYDPVGNVWTAGGNKLGPCSSEETWVLLPDETILTCNCFGHPNTEKYVIVSNQWVTAGSTPTDLVENSSKEIGPGVLLPDGRAFFIGSTGRTALYTVPPVGNQPGTWVSGPTFPTQGGQQLIGKDAPGCLLRNGKVLCAVSPVGPCPAIYQGYCPPTYFFEFNPADGTLTQISNPSNNGDPVFSGRMLLLPTGEVLFSDDQQQHVELYTPDGVVDPSWLPQITGCPANVEPGFTYTLHGRQLNGLSQAISYGDDASMATNYPIVRIKNLANNKVFYCRTHNHSTMGVQTGTVINSTQFTVPHGIDLGSSELCVIANGISSACVPVLVNNKIWKELKWEIKENFKREIDVVNKLVPEVKDKGEVEGGIKISLEGDPWKRLVVEYPELVRIIGILAERSDKIEEKSQKGHFISADERPQLGEEAVRKSKKKQRTR